MAEVHADRASRGKEVLGVGDVARSLTRIAYEIVERNGGSDNLVIAGIPTRGATLARRLVNRIREVSGTYAELAIIDTTMYRDDLASQPLRAPKETWFLPLALMARPSSLSTTCCTPAAPLRLRSMLSRVSVAPRPSSSQSSSTGAIASFRFARITLAKTCRRHATKSLPSCSTKQTGAMASFLGKACKR